MCRRGPGQEYVKSSLGVTLMELVNYTNSLEIDPVKVKGMILFVHLHRVCAYKARCNLYVNSICMV